MTKDDMRAACTKIVVTLPDSVIEQALEVLRLVQTYTPPHTNPKTKRATR